MANKKVEFVRNNRINIRTSEPEYRQIFAYFGNSTRIREYLIIASMNSNEFFDSYHSKINWDLFSQYNKISPWFYEKYKKCINKSLLSRNHNLTEEFVLMFMKDTKI